MRMAKVFEHTDCADPAGWYFQFNLEQPVGPFGSKTEAETALRIARPPPADAPALELARNLLARLAELESDITRSRFNGGDDAHDRPPEGDDYNLLHDAIMDEVRSAVGAQMQLDLWSCAIEGASRRRYPLDADCYVPDTL